MLKLILTLTAAGTDQSFNTGDVDQLSDHSTLPKMMLINIFFNDVAQFDSYRLDFDIGLHQSIRYTSNFVCGITLLKSKCNEVGAFFRQGRVVINIRFEN